jgi:hypothetical protein
MYVWGSFAAVRAHETRADQEKGGIINVCPVVCPFGSYVLPLIHIPLRPSGPFGTRGKETILAAILGLSEFWRQSYAASRKSPPRPSDRGHMVQKHYVTLDQPLLLRKQERRDALLFD